MKLKDFEILLILLLNPILNFLLNILSSKLTETYNFRIRSAWIWLLSIIICLSLAYTVTLDKEYENLSNILLLSIGFIFLIFIFDCIYLLIYNKENKKNQIDKNKLQAEVNKLQAEIKKLTENSSQLNKNTNQQVIPTRNIFNYKFKPFKNKYITLVTGDIRDIDFIDIWVNSENTNMQMSRYYELSISGIIRYLGAKKDKNNNVIEDIINNELSNSLNNALYVQPATVIITSAGKLEETHNVKKIFHVASVQGEVGVGYRPIYNIKRCVTNPLKEAEKVENISTILFPLIGTGQAKRNLEEISKKLIDSAINYINCYKNSKIRGIFFLVRTQSALKVCRKILNEYGELELQNTP